VSFQIRLAEAHLAAHEKLLAADTYTKLLEERGDAPAAPLVALRLASLYIGIDRTDLATIVRRRSEGTIAGSLPDPYALVWPLELTPPASSTTCWARFAVGDAPELGTF
jgi:hypothetical protein